MRKDPDTARRRAPSTSAAIMLALLVSALGAFPGHGETHEESATMETTEMRTATVFDFESEARAWPSIDDVVMGGVSSSEMTIADGGGHAVFAGELSLENNGGFASVRSRPADHDLAGFDGVRVRVRGDGRTYGFRLRDVAGFDGVSYQAPLPTEAGAWTEVSIPFSAFEPVFRGRRVPRPPIDPGEIKTFGVIIADGQPGDFRLEIDRIEAYRE